MDVSRYPFPHRAGTESSSLGTSRRRFVVTAEEEASGLNFVRYLSSFANSGGVPETSKLSDLLNQAGVPDHKTVEYHCYEKAKAVASSGALSGGCVTIDDAAIIASFTFQDPSKPGDSAPFAILNNSLATRDASRLKAVLPYAIALLNALRKLKRYVNRGHLYRGIDCKNTYKVGSEETWWRFSSTSLKKDIAIENFLGIEKGSTVTTYSGTVFIISKGWGYDIRPFSFYDKEEEIILDIERTVKILGVRTGNIQEVDVELLDTAIVETPTMCPTNIPSEPPTYRERRGPPGNPPPPGHWGPPPPGHPGHPPPPGHCGPPPCPYCGHRPGPPPGPPPPCPGCGRRPPPPPGPRRGPPPGPPPHCPYCHHPPPPPPPCSTCHRRPPPPPGHW